MPPSNLPTRQPRWFTPDSLDVVYQYGQRAVYKAYNHANDTTYILKRTPNLDGIVNTEAATHRFLVESTAVPVPIVYGEWLSPNRERHYLLEERISGQSLTDCWSQLSGADRLSIAEQVASHMTALSRYTSSRMQTINGHRLPNNNFVPSPTPRHDFLPRCSTGSEIFSTLFRPALERAGVASHLIRKARDTMPPCSDQLVFTHCDLFTGNVMVDPRRARVTAIIDWESAGFWPGWFQYARITHGCNGDDGDWKRLLSRVMRDQIPHGEHGRVWWNAMDRLLERPRGAASRAARVWLGLLDLYVSGEVGVESLRGYRDLEESY